MLLNQTILITKTGLSKEQQRHYIDLGYNMSQKTFEVDVKHLSQGSGKKVKVMCDYCLEQGVENIYEQVHYTYWNLRNKSPIKKDACQSHTVQKRKDSCKETYGVENVNLLPEIREKIKETNLKKYGVEYSLQDEDIRNKGRETCKEKYGKDWYTQTKEYSDRVKKTNLERYGTEWYMQSDDFEQKTKSTLQERHGVDHPMHVEEYKNNLSDTMLERYGVVRYSQLPEWNEKVKNTLMENYGVDNPMRSEEIQAKAKETNLERYGVENPFQSEEIKEKIKATNLEKYGVENPSQSPEIREKIALSFYERGSAPTSTQQIHVHNIIGGELNYPVGNILVDMAFVDEKIYVECDFSGHWLSITLNSETEEDFTQRQRKRWYYLYRKGWKEIRIISRNDLVPTDSKINDMLIYAKNYLEQGHHYIRFDVDNQKVICSQFSEDYDFGELTKITKRNATNLTVS